ADFDKAIIASGFGRYNLVLLLLAIPATCANMFESTTMSYILPIADCDLHLTLTDKGILNACAYAGMIISAIPWGYLADRKGRRMVLIYGYLMTFVCGFGSALSQNFIMLVTFKFFGGLMVNGPSAVLFTYLTEMHGPKHRSQVLMVVGMITSASQFLLPLMAWATFPRQWDFVFFGSLNIHNWHIFLFICCLASLTSGLIMCLMPESPRFLMAHGRNVEALHVLQRIYHINTGKPKDSYPIKSLILEAPNRNAKQDEVIYTIDEKPAVVATKPDSRTLLESLRAAMQQIKPMFHKPLLSLSLHCYTMQFCIFLGMNTIRLWLPQLFASMAEYELAHADDKDASATMCTILEFSVNKTAETLTNYENACAEMASPSVNTGDFETAIAECGFGLFNVMILICAMPCLFSMVFSGSTMSFIMPTAECELELSMFDKGVMNAVTFAGMIISAFPWGFVADTMGRRIVLIVGGLSDGVCVMCAALSQNSTQLMIFKFFNGVFICGPFAVIVSYLSESHGKKHRHFIMLYVGLSLALGALVLPVLAHVMLPLHININVGQYSFHAWHLFLAITGLPSLMSGTFHIFLPESPKFLMSQGQYRKAMGCFQLIYAMNKRKRRESFPITKLTDTTPERVDSLPQERVTMSMKSMRQLFRAIKLKGIEGMKQLKPMFSSPYLGLSVRVYVLHLCQITSVNSVRLWLPEIFSTMHSFEVHGIDLSMCSVLNESKSGHIDLRETKLKECDRVGRRSIDQHFQALNVLSSQNYSKHFPPAKHSKSRQTHTDLFFANSTTSTLILSAMYLTILGICTTTVIGLIIVEFPTLMRTMVLLLIMTFGRLGSFGGNILLPLFIELSCWAPFIWLSSILSIAFVISLFLNIDIQKALN
ncbi:GH17356, partial [Drosophila grimshawi]